MADKPRKDLRYHQNSNSTATSDVSSNNVHNDRKLYTSSHESVWYFLKNESYSCISHISEFQSYQQQQETKSVCSYIFDPSSQYTSNTATDTASNSYSSFYSKSGNIRPLDSSYLETNSEYIRDSYENKNHIKDQPSTSSADSAQTTPTQTSTSTTTSADNSNNYSGNLYLIKESIWRNDTNGIVNNASAYIDGSMSYQQAPVSAGSYSSAYTLDSSVGSLSSSAGQQQQQQQRMTINRDPSYNNIMAYLQQPYVDNNNSNSNNMKTSTSSIKSSTSSTSSGSSNSPFFSNYHDNNFIRDSNGGYQQVFSNSNGNGGNESSHYLSNSASSTSSNLSTSNGSTISTNTTNTINNINNISRQGSAIDSLVSLANSISINSNNNNTATANADPTATNKQEDGNTTTNVLPWNESFQQLLDLPIKSLEDERIRNQNITFFSELLAAQASKYVKTLVREVHLNPNLKTIKPYNCGGLAGGLKYSIDNMFIKFALNPYGIYEQQNPTSYFANKAAGHELKSINSLVSCAVPNLHFPLMCILNFRGFRLSVISELPISSNTIVFGSSNAGHMIHDNQTVYKMMVKIAEMLNLKTHLVEQSKSGGGDLFKNTAANKQFSIPLAVDIEGHFGFDGRYYIVDSARLFPPESPAYGITGGFLYRLFRTEFLKRYETQLCADAFSNFNIVNPKQHNDEVEKATDFLVEQVIPNFAKHVLPVLPIAKLNIKEHLHKEGINLRYLGLVLYHVVSTSLQNKHKDELIGKFVIEMLSRILRYIIFSEMRKLNEIEDEPHLYVALTHLNLILSPYLTGNNFIYWTQFISNSLVAKYTSSLHAKPTQELCVTQLIRDSKGFYLYFSNDSNRLRYKLLKKFTQLTGIIISPSYLERLKNNRDNSSIIPPLILSDILEIQITVKHMKVSPSFKAFEQFPEAEQYYLKELEFKSNKLGNDHTQVAYTHVHLADLYSSYSLLVKAEKHLHLSLQIYQSRFGPDDISYQDIKEKLAVLCIKQKKFDEAIKLLKEILDVKKKQLSSDNIDIADTCDNIAWAYQNRGDFQLSLTYYTEALKIKMDKTGNSMSTAKTLNNLGHLFFSNNELVKSLDIFSKVKEIFIQQKGPDHSDVGTAYDNLGMVYSKSREYQLAEKSFKSAIEIRSKQFGKESRLVAITQDHLAQLYVSWDKTKYDDATKLLQSSIHIVDQFPDFYSQAFMRFSLSKVYKAKKEKQQELKLLNESIQIFDLHNIQSDLTPKIRKRIQDLSKSGLSKLISWINNPVVKMPPPVTLINHNMVESQMYGGHMEMKNDNSSFVSKSSSIPKEWQDLFSEAGISNEDMADPKYSEAIREIIEESFKTTATSNRATAKKSVVANSRRSIRARKESAQETIKTLQKDAKNLLSSSSVSSSSSSVCKEQTTANMASNGSPKLQKKQPAIRSIPRPSTAIPPSGGAPGAPAPTSSLSKFKVKSAPPPPMQAPTALAPRPTLSPIMAPITPPAPISPVMEPTPSSYDKSSADMRHKRVELQKPNQKKSATDIFGLFRSEAPKEKEASAPQPELSRANSPARAPIRNNNIVSRSQFADQLNVAPSAAYSLASPTPVPTATVTSTTSTSSSLYPSLSDPVPQPTPSLVFSPTLSTSPYSSSSSMSPYVASDSSPYTSPQLQAHVYYPPPSAPQYYQQQTLASPSPQPSAAYYAPQYYQQQQPLASPPPQPAAAYYAPPPPPPAASGYHAPPPPPAASGYYQPTPQPQIQQQQQAPARTSYFAPPSQNIPPLQAYKPTVNQLYPVVPSISSYDMTSQYLSIEQQQLEEVSRMTQDLSQLQEQAGAIQLDAIEQEQEQEEQEERKEYYDSSEDEGYDDDDDDDGIEYDEDEDDEYYQQEQQQEGIYWPQFNLNLINKEKLIETIKKRIHETKTDVKSVMKKI
ncbi:hypothetical protein CYY_001421 [Polysphondylium violaceum]|uniref:Clu domain-containing protein n=1 Tax=Polysphondylium violaceum TaxID=133409 RepID=A0A8J4UW85_9MYCE|nr:hypothetical protein CYY_001421 [Polysphondylium violaceum]